MLEYEYRKRHPRISHDEYLSLVNDPEFWELLRAQLRGVLVTQVPKMIREYADRGLKGDLTAARWVLAEFGLSQERKETLGAVSQSYEGLKEALTAAIQQGLTKK